MDCENGSFSEKLLSDGRGSSSDDGGATTSPLRAFGRLLLVWVAAAACGGVLPGQVAFTNMFAHADIFVNVCKDGTRLCDEQYMTLTNVFSTLQGAAFLAFLPGGMFFDNIGGRVTGVIGALILAGGVVMLAATLSLRASLGGPTETLFVISVFVIDIGSLINNQAFFSLLWHLPGWQGLLIALSNTCYQVSALLPNILQGLMRTFDLNLSEAFVIYMLAVLLATAVLWAAVPSQREYFGEAAKVLGVPLPRVQVTVEDIRMRFVKACKVIAHDKFDHMQVVLPLVLAFSTVYDYSLGTIFGRALFGSQSAGAELANQYTKITFLVGCFMGPVLGLAADALGLKSLAFSTLAAVTVVVCFFSIPNWNAQYLAMTACAVFYNTLTLFLQRYVLFYAPPQHFGTATGLLVSATALTAVVVMVGLYYWMNTYPKGITRFVQPVLAFGICAVLGWIWISIKMLLVPLPDSVVLLEEDEHDLCKQFFVGNFKDAEEVLGMPRKEILRLLSSLDVRSQAQVVKAISQERLLAVARRVAATMPPAGTPKLPHTDGARLSLGGGWLLRADIPLEAIVPILTTSFNGVTTEAAEPAINYFMGAKRADPADPLRKNFVEYVMSLAGHAARRFGYALSLCREENPDFPLSVCLAYGPNCLDKSGKPLAAGHDDFLYAMAQVGKPLPHLDRAAFGMGFLQRWAAVEGSPVYSAKVGRLRRSSWYVHVLGVHPEHQGKGAGKKMLQIIYDWADRDGVSCLLECGEIRVALYERCGLKEVLPRSYVEPEDEDHSPPFAVCLMERKPLPKPNDGGKP